MCRSRAGASIHTRNSRRWIRRISCSFAAGRLVAWKNALLKQYQRLFEFENVRLRSTEEALETVAELALQRKVGARGLRMILEDLMLELMYHLPMQRKVREFVVSAEMVRTREINWSLLEKAG